MSFCGFKKALNRLLVVESGNWLAAQQQEEHGVAGLWLQL
jgi:hypothetical protein